MTTLKDALGDFRPDTALVLGSGLADALTGYEEVSRHAYGNLDGFAESGVEGHVSEVVAARFGKHDVLILKGRQHYYEHGNAAAMRGPLEAVAACGVKRLILTNAAGSLDADQPPGSVMSIKDHINLSGTNPLIGEPSNARFVGMTSAYDKPLRKRFRAAAKDAGIEMRRGVYMWFSGPSFETPAEIRMAKRLGADAVGMSTVPEVILARFLGLQCAAFSVITNFGAGMTGDELSHQETQDMAPEGGLKLAKILQTAFEKGLDE
ncbi:purine-nucleoside phosphorylase [Ahrensia sp. R2A130]|uniref:purine-nucleoside phosphorylase n=1 Tax=Ahrensia sp. R2A130 TaxID=744979 RepID=UPI0001E0A4D1|nr:purine-nucleoside phosphorylase [Ahrensia sp. R2A130]EFL88435.1 purine nucleotide phosphorylase [Ahrensia sp. R2A130]